MNGASGGTRDSGGWRELAACRGQNSDYWLSGNVDGQAYARQVCSSCPVAGDCLDNQLRYEDTTGSVPKGIVGGTDHHERLVIHRARGVLPSGSLGVALPWPSTGKAPLHGTQTAYYTHGCRCGACETWSVENDHYRKVAS